MNRRGHLIFALGLGAIVFYLLKDFNIISIPINIVLFHLPFYLFGAILVDRIERPTSRWHRGLLHSRRMLLISLFILTPYLIYKTMHYPQDLFLGVNYNYFSLGLAGLLGNLTHLIGDSLTSKLPR